MASRRLVCNGWKLNIEQIIEQIYDGSSSSSHHVLLSPGPWRALEVAS